MITSVNLINNPNYRPPNPNQQINSHNDHAPLHGPLFFLLRRPPLFTQRSSQEPSSSQSPTNVLQLACPNFPACCVSHQPSLSSLPTTHSSWTTHTSPHYHNPLTDPVRWSLTASRVAGIRPHMSICSVIYPTRQESPKSLIRRTLSNSESPERSSFTSFKHPGLLISLVWRDLGDLDPCDHSPRFV